VNSIILRTATRFILPLMLLFSIVILLQGHNKPGGGFIGGLLAAAAYSLHALAFDPATTRRMIGIDLRSLIGLGLVVALVSGLIPLAMGRPFMTGVWTTINLGGGEPLKVGTPLLFDLGVYSVVLGIALLMVLTLLDPDEDDGKDESERGAG
jgi:multicomponent Na+:H+ antiporter subunit B